MQSSFQMMVLPLVCLYSPATSFTLIVIAFLRMGSPAAAFRMPEADGPCCRSCRWGLAAGSNQVSMLASLRESSWATVKSQQSR